MEFVSFTLGNFTLGTYWVGTDIIVMAGAEDYP
jgi:hypothetical protein